MHQHDPVDEERLPTHISALIVLSIIVGFFMLLFVGSFVLAFFGGEWG